MYFPWTKPLSASRQLLACFALFWLSSATADTVTVAVSSNFSNALAKLQPLFELQTGHDLVVSTGATGKHYAQIVQGAPFDLFLAADSHRPALLEQQGFAIKDSRVTYAIGYLAIWHPNLPPSDNLVRTLSPDFRIAIANPRHAPYGIAAKQVLTNLNEWNDRQHQLVQGENVNQTYQFVATENADIGFVALSQLLQAQVNNNEYWLVPQSYYSPIEQQMVLLSDTEPVRDLYRFMLSDQAQAIILQLGYRVAP